MPVEKTGVSFAPEIWAELERRGHGNRSAIISRSLDRYFAVLAAYRQDLQTQFSDAEIALILDAFNGVAFWDITSVRLAWANVQDAIEMDSLDTKWGVNDPAGLVAKLKALDLARLVALVDAAEMWWHRVAQGERPKPIVAEVLS